MDEQFSHKKFIFNEKIDRAFLNSLYEDDFPYIEEVFHTTLENFPEDIWEIQSAFNSKDIVALKKAVHKIKPVFGFTGLLRAQELSQQFENACLNADSINQIQPQYELLISVIDESRTIIESDYKKLKEYNASSI